MMFAYKRSTAGLLQFSSEIECHMCRSHLLPVFFESLLRQEVAGLMHKLQFAEYGDARQERHR